jgi:multiple sugar transport system permease protein
MASDNRAITSSRTRKLLTCFVAAVIAVWLFPVLWMVLTSFKPSDEIARRVPIFVFEPTLDHYRVLLDTYHFSRFFVTSLIVSSLTTIFALTVACPAAYALGCIDFPRSKDIAMWILSQRMLPPVAVIIPFFILFRRLDLIDTPIGLVVVNMVQALPFAVWLLRGFFVEVPLEIREAALLDHLGHGQILSRVVVPLAAPGIAVTAIFTFIFSWNEFLFALFLTTERATTVPVGVSQLILAYQVLWGEVSAAGSLALIPLVLVVFYMQKHIVRGMTLGAVK